MLKMEFVNLCNQNVRDLIAKQNEVVALEERNRRAMEYSASVRAKKNGTAKHNLTMLATFLCANATIFYVLIDAFL